MSLLSIVVVTFNSKELLRSLLLSIKADPSLTPLLSEIVVVDNGSEDSTEEMVRGEFAECLLLKEKKNTGFARAANRGARCAKGKYVLFLNSDTLLVPGEVKRMVDLMEKEASIAILAPGLLSPNGKAQRSYALTPSLFFEFVPRGLFEKKQLETLCDVPSVIGAAMLVRREVFEELSGFDEGFFFFLEETDLCVRARKRGYRVVCYPLCHVVHAQGSTVRKKWVEGRIEYNISLYRFIRKYHGLPYFLLFLALRFLKAAAFVIFLSPFLFFLHGRSRASFLYHARLLIWHLRGRPRQWGLRPR